MAAMQRKGNHPAGLYGGGHQNPAAVKSYKKQPVAQPSNVRVPNVMEGNKKLKVKHKREQECSKEEGKIAQDRRKREEKIAQDRRKREEKIAQDRRKREEKIAQDRRKKEEKIAQDRRKKEEKIAQDHRKKEEKIAQDRRKKEEKIAQDRRKKEEKIAQDRRKKEEKIAQDRHKKEEKIAQDHRKKEGKVAQDHHKKEEKIAQERRQKKIKESSGKVQFTMYKASDIDAAVSKPEMRLRGTGTDYSVYKSNLGAITIPCEGASPSKEEFTQAVETFKNIQHRNLTNLVGACTPRRVLVYELLPNGTLEDRLADKKFKKSFDWKARVTTAASICSAVEHLHRIKPKLIIHDDLKSSNIHFGAKNLCKLSNFGVSSLLRSTKHGVEQFVEGIKHAINGTDAHKIQIQTDVSALGVILLQIVTGRPDARGVRDFVAGKLGDESGFYGKKTSQKKAILKKVVDPELKNRYPVEGAARMLFLGLRCTDPAGKQCPSLASEVLPQIKSCHATVHFLCFWS
uniref:RING-type E3 ubiquitin transferase n=1 Tax=Oryza punctata TaxID=4537 RepID=A0A0E0MH97_ORYPU